MPVSCMVVVFWLAESYKGTKETRADHFANVLAGKCMIGRDHNTARLLGIVYLGGCLSLVSNVMRHGNSSLPVPVLFVCTFTLTASQKVLHSLGVPEIMLRPIEVIVRAIHLNRENPRARVNLEEYIQDLQARLMSMAQSEKDLKIFNREHQKCYVALDQNTKDLQSRLDKLRKKNEEEVAHETFNAQKQILHWQSTCRQEQARSRKLNSQISTLQQDLRAALKDCAIHLCAKNEAELKLKSLINVATRIYEAEPSLRSDLAVPFVLVLVDGDAYQWSDIHFLQTKYPPGASAAQSIKREVQHYLIDHQNELPLQSRIVVRAFQNIQVENYTSPLRSGDAIIRYPCNFFRDFTQAMPLFDYIDSGGGKERVDSKIQETVHLFLANSSCQRIFLAAATDNGFARLLEQYAYDDILRNKIILVHPGFVIREIETLGFPAMEWPSVFQKKCVPPESRAKAQRIAVATAKADRDRAVATTKMMIEIAPGLDVFGELSRAGVSGSFHGNGLVLGEKSHARIQRDIDDEDPGSDGIEQDDGNISDEIE